MTETRAIIDMDREADPNQMAILQDGVEASIDHVVGDTLVPGTGYAGMVATSSGTVITIGVGRLYSGSKVYAFDTPLTFDVAAPNHLPAATQRICLVVAYGQELDTDLAPVNFLVEAQSTPTAPVYKAQLVATTHRRLAVVQPAYGDEAPNPAWPGYGLALPVAVAVLGPTGIVSLSNVPGNLVPNLVDVATRTAVLEAWRSLTDPTIKSITSDLAALRNELNNLPTSQLPYALAADVAEIKEQLRLPQNYSNYRADDFFDATYSNAAAAGYHASTEEGLRFPPANVFEQQLALNNQYDATVVTAANGLVLPKYQENVQRIVAGGVNYTALSQYAYETRNAEVLTVGMARVRYGEQFEESSGSAFFLSGQFIGGTTVSNAPTYSAASVFLLNGQTYQVTDTGTTDDTGHEIERLQQFWTDYSGSPYWSRVSSLQPTTGYAWVETFLQQGDKWVTALSIRVAKVPASGTIYVGLCQCTNGYPDITKMLVLQPAQASQLTPGASLGGNKVPIPPILLTGGQRYGYVLITNADFYVGTVETGTSPTTGSLFYGLNGGVWNIEPGYHLMFDVWYASFATTALQVELQGQNLNGGIGAIDITNGQVVPSSCKITFAVFINNAWMELSQQNQNMLASLPPYVRLAMRLTGTQDVMPGISFALSRVRVSRPDTAVKHVSVPEVLATASKTIQVESTLINFDDDHHNFNSRLYTGAGYGTMSLPATVVDVVRDGTTLRTETYTFANAVSAYVREIDESTDSAFDLFVCSNCTEVAQ